jgi:hypothetical protein
MKGSLHTQQLGGGYLENPQQFDPSKPLFLIEMKKRKKKCVKHGPHVHF